MWCNARWLKIEEAVVVMLANSVAESRDRCHGATILSKITGDFIASSKLRMRVGVERS